MVGQLSSSRRAVRGYYRKDGHPTDEVRMIKTALKIVRKLFARPSIV
jgi:hypothetical protein